MEKNNNREKKIELNENKTTKNVTEGTKKVKQKFGIEAGEDATKYGKFIVLQKSNIFVKVL